MLIKLIIVKITITRMITIAAIEITGIATISIAMIIAKVRKATPTAIVTVRTMLVLTATVLLVGILPAVDLRGTEGTEETGVIGVTEEKEGTALVRNDHQKMELSATKMRNITIRKVCMISRKVAATITLIAKAVTASATAVRRA